MEMEDYITYSTVVIKNGPPRSTETEDHTTVYSEVKSKTTEVPPTDLKLEPTVQAETEATPRPPLLLLCLWILCFLLTGSMIIIILISVSLTDQTAENQHLLADRRTLQNQSEGLRGERDHLNQTLRVILTFDNFPVQKFCPEKQCGPCRADWVLFQGKCYLFYNKNSPWKSWEDSRRFCQDGSADLVVVDDLREQEFISENTKFYYDEFHGFWLGLQRTRTGWVWVDGRNDTLGFWGSESAADQELKVLLIPGQNSTKNWNPRKNEFQNKFICEHEALRW
ncbi:CD209 antigen-like protein E [Austrofundulus limnaeus]|uniref:CD209 antigen-like protein E n=1 Tax=Austrofundulus limnaeus TaxID=52670 RepID=A0A2I4CPF9_AUSLI|nr:PREDICTED: CD209 antigen-like protein E [Austrofundulus limnaeus]